MDTRWTIQLLGGLRAEHGDRVVTRFQTRRAAALLAYLAYYRNRAHPREVLIELLWPGSDLETGRKSLSVALSSLRHELELSGSAAGSFLIADRFSVQLNPLRVTTDVAAFEGALQAAGQADNDALRAELLKQAIDYYRGPLLPGYYESWIASEQERLTDLLCQALIQLSALLEQTGDLHNALDCARRVAGIDPLREEAARQLMRLYTATGQVSAALRQYHELERALRQELNATPSAATRALADLLRSDTGSSATDGEETEATLISRLPPMTPALHSFIPASSTPNVRASQAPRLPLPLTRFIGRQEETSRIEALLSTGRSRLITLTGPGGSGKTRLAIEVAERVKKRFDERVWFVPLYDVSDPRLIMDRILNALGLGRSPHVSSIDQVVEALSDRPAILVLDNFEQLVEEGTPQVRTLLEWTPQLTCIVTSRQRMNLSGEQEFAVLPLPIPATREEGRGKREEGSDALSSLLDCASVQLFVDRAQAVRPDFQVTSENAPAVAQLCADLEGIPLAIELAAARAQVLTPPQMLAQLEDRFNFLVSRKRDVEPRHRTLRAAIDWSYRLLSPELQRFFSRLSVFRGGWTIEAAQAVCGADEGITALGRSGVQENAASDSPEGQKSRLPENLNKDTALDYLEHLRECSLVLVEESEDAMRFRMLDTLREYGEEQLSPDETVALQQRHRDWFLALAEETEPNLQGPNQTIWLNRLEEEYDNMRAALEWCLAEETGAEKGLRLAAALERYWSMRGYFGEGYGWLRRALARGGSARVRAKALIAAGEMAHFLSEHAQAEALFRESLALFREQGNQHGVAQALNGLGTVAVFNSGFPEARTLLEESLAIFRELGDRWGAALALNNLGDLYSDYSVIRPLQEESLALFRSLGDKQGIAFALYSLGRAFSGQGDHEAARAYTEESLALFQELGSSWGTAFALVRLGEIEVARRNYPAARSSFEEGLENFRITGNKMGASQALLRLGELAVEQGDYFQARTLFEESLAMRQEAGNRLALVQVLGSLGALARKEGDWERAHALFEECLAIWREFGHRVGVASSFYSLAKLAQDQNDYERAVALYKESISVYREIGAERGIVACLEGLAASYAMQGLSKRAAQLFGVAEMSRESLRYPVHPMALDDYEHDLAIGRALLDDADCAIAWGRGRSMDMEGAISYALEPAEVTTAGRC